MEQEIREFIEYLHNTKKTSQNTEVSYRLIPIYFLIKE